MKSWLDDYPIRPTTALEVIDNVCTVWDELNPVVDTLPHIISMPLRVRAVIAANGGHTKY